jgi:hypothetical protein
VNTNDSIIEDLRLVPLPNLWANPLTWIAIALLAGFIVLLISRWVQSRPRPLKPQVPPLPGPPPHTIALNRLQELRARHAKMSAYDVALECSDILRRYIEARFASPIRYQTTREFLGAIHASGELTGESRRELGEFLEFFDSIKFAQANASAERTGAAIDGAERFVRKCIPAEVAKP